MVSGESEGILAFRTKGDADHYFSQTDEASLLPRKFLIDVDDTLEALLEREDTDKNMQITIEDAGPKVRLSLVS